MAILVVLKAEYSTAVLLMVTTVSLYLFHTKSIQKNMLLFILFILLYILFDAYLVDILKLLQSLTEGTTYHLKLQDSIASIRLGEATGTTADRVERYYRSMNIFFENPIVGIWSYAPVGKHSLILDTFAQYGIFAGIALIYILLKVPYQILQTHTKNRTLALTVLILIIALFSLNNINMSYGFMFYIFYPYIIQRLENA